MIFYRNQRFKDINTTKPRNMKIVRLLLHNREVKDAVTIDTGFGLEFRKDSEALLIFEEDVKGWWYI